MLALTSLSFDIAGAGAAGCRCRRRARVVLADAQTAHDPRLLLKACCAAPA